MYLRGHKGSKKTNKNPPVLSQQELAQLLTTQGGTFQVFPALFFPEPAQSVPRQRDLLSPRVQGWHLVPGVAGTPSTSSQSWANTSTGSALVWVCSAWSTLASTIWRRLKSPVPKKRRRRRQTEAAGPHHPLSSHISSSLARKSLSCPQPGHECPLPVPTARDHPFIPSNLCLPAGI